MFEHERDDDATGIPDPNLLIKDPDTWVRTYCPKVPADRIADAVQLIVKAGRIEEEELRELLSGPQ